MNFLEDIEGKKKIYYKDLNSHAKNYVDYIALIKTDLQRHVDRFYNTQHPPCDAVSFIDNIKRALHFTAQYIERFEQEIIKMHENTDKQMTITITDEEYQVLMLIKRNLVRKLSELALEIAQAETEKEGHILSMKVQLLQELFK